MRFILSTMLLLVSLHLSAQVSDLAKIYYEKEDGSIMVYADNFSFAPITVSLTFNYKGLKLKKPLEDYYVIRPQLNKQFLVELVMPEGRSWDFKYSYEYYLGDPDAVHDDEHIYRIPFAENERYSLDQGYNGRVTHMGKNALDFKMPEGSEIVAARAGIVIETKSDSDSGCPSVECSNDANYVRILHNDGTFSSYAHLKFNGVTVQVGEKVEQGQLIGYSGKTGWASGPHLHFEVFKFNGSKEQTFQTLFKISSNETGFLKEGKLYTGVR